MIEEVAAEAPIEVPMDYTLRLESGDALEVSHHPYVYSYDTRAFKVGMFHEFTDGIPLTAFKAVFVNTIEAFVKNYADTVWAMVQASERCRKKIQFGEPILDPQTGMNLIGRAQARAEHAYSDLLKWNGQTEFTVLLPYSETGFGGPNLKDDEINTSACRPVVNGMMFVMRHNPHADGK